jgi:hypothetical protein
MQLCCVLSLLNRRYGKLEPGAPNSGVLQETGFGVSFPNYIVDVQKNIDGGCVVTQPKQSHIDIPVCV